MALPPETGYAVKTVGVGFVLVVGAHVLAKAAGASGFVAQVATLAIILLVGAIAIPRHQP